MKALAYFSFIAVIHCSCIKPEPKSPEADILRFHLPDSALKPNQDSVITGTNITILVKKDKIDITKVVPSLILSTGATCSPASGQAVDLTNPVTYTVTSENGQYRKNYKVSLIYSIDLYHPFDSWKEDPQSHYQTPNDRNTSVWTSGNAGVSIFLANKKPENYPAHATTNSAQGPYAAELTTIKGPGNVIIQYVPIAAGSLFLGNFNAAIAGNQPLKATQFGQPFDEEPVKITGKYQYKPGPLFTDKNGNAVAKRIDTCAIYAVMFKTDNNVKYLTGDNVLSSPNIIATAQLPNGSATPGTGFIDFDIPFVFSSQPDFEHNTYSLTVVFSSSHKGATYEGAVGSKLIVDELTIVTKK